MTLTFTPSAQVYDPDGDAIRFLALDGQRLVICSVCASALLQADRLAAADPRRLLMAYFRHQSRIQAIANAKYERWPRPPARVAIEPEDLAA